MPRALPALLAALASLAISAPAALADLVYVLNSGEASISVIDAESRQEVRRIPVLREPHHLILAPDRRALIVGDSGGNELLSIDPETSEIIERQRFSNPYHLEVSPDGKLLVVTSLRRNQVDIYAYPSLELLQRLRVSDMPSHIAYSPDSRFAYITLQGTRGLMAIDLQSKEAAWTIDVGPQPAGVMWHNDRLLVGAMGTDHMVVVNPGTRAVERTVQTARGSHTVWLSPDRRIIYANSRVDSRITLLDAETLERIGSWEIPGGPDDISFDPDGRLWVTLRWVARIAVVNPGTGEYETIRVGRSPHGIYVHGQRPQAPAEPRPEEPDAPPEARAAQPAAEGLAATPAAAPVTPGDPVAAPEPLALAMRAEDGTALASVGEAPQAAPAELPEDLVAPRRPEQRSLLRRLQGR